MNLKTTTQTARHPPAAAPADAPRIALGSGPTGVSRPAPAARPELPAVPRRLRVAAALASAFISLALMQTIAASFAPQAIGHGEVAARPAANPRG